MKKIFPLILFIAFLLPLTVSADILSPYQSRNDEAESQNKKLVDHCYEIENFSNYPGYTFLIWVDAKYGASNVVSYTPLKKGKNCFNYYISKYTKYYIGATKEPGWESIVKKYGLRTNIISYMSEEIYDLNDIKFINSNKEITPYNLTDKQDPLKEVVSILRVKSLTSTNLSFEEIKNIYYYDSGPSFDMNYDNNLIKYSDRPDGKKPGLNPVKYKKLSTFTVILGYVYSNLWYLLPIVSLVLIAGIIVFRKRNR